jgi:predicted dehydrogenase
MAALDRPATRLEDLLMLHKGNLSRRGFLQQSTAGLAAAGLPLWYAREIVAAQDEQKDKKPSANDRITLGVIGSGDRSKQLIGDLGRHKNQVQILACCDVDRRHRNEVAGIVKQRWGNECAAYEDFRELCARKDIQAVLVVTPDHWHTLPTICAMKSGKDVYCEKPLTLTVVEGQALVKVAGTTGRVLQTGSQQRSDGRFRMACELVRNGRIGKVVRVETRIGDNPNCPPLPVHPVPEGLNWDFWLGPTPKVDYVQDPKSKEKFPPSRCHYQFRWWYEYSGGKMTDWGAHHNDIAQWGLGTDGTGPVAIAATATPPPKETNRYNCHTNFKITYTYANGATVVCTPGKLAGAPDKDGTRTKGRDGKERRDDHGNGVLFVGESGAWIFVNRGLISASDEKLLKEPLPSSATRLYVSNDHMGNWLKCLRSREKPICDVEVGHRSVTVCHLGNIAVRSGKSLKWDPSKEQFDDSEANQWLGREMRAPWKLEV